MNVYVENMNDPTDDFNTNGCQCAFGEDALETNWSNSNRDRLPASAYPFYSRESYIFNNDHPLQKVGHETFHMMQLNSIVTANLWEYDQNSFFLESTASWFQRWIENGRGYTTSKVVGSAPGQHLVPEYSIWRYDGDIGANNSSLCTELPQLQHRYNMEFWWKYMIQEGAITPNDIANFFYSKSSYGQWLH